ncbi:class II aldolase/adducin family protein [Planotetraspora sp. GP83]|uniref:class II aldolase/adducin family protein n=1 Tax=Planotetraspora sp. GP83 TaxID=3156264 RepID=UPI003516ED6A
MDSPTTEHVKRQLVLALRLFAVNGFDEGAGGHITARDPERPDHFWINPFGRSFAHVAVADLLLVDHAGEVVEGQGKVNPAGYAIHSAIHAARPDVHAAAHSHSVYGRAFATLGRLLDPITQDACVFFEDHALHQEFGGVVLEGKQVAASLGDAKAVIMRNHGLLTVGGTVEEAAWWFLAMDRCCQVQLIAEAAGKPHLIDPETARLTRGQIGTPGTARLNFRPLREHILTLFPDIS